MAKDYETAEDECQTSGDMAETGKDEETQHLFLNYIISSENLL